MNNVWLFFNNRIRIQRCLWTVYEKDFLREREGREKKKREKKKKKRGIGREREEEEKKEERCFPLTSMVYVIMIHDDP